MGLVKSAMAISSGTLGAWTGLSRYEEIDAVQWSFVMFCAGADTDCVFEAWQRFWVGA